MSFVVIVVIGVVAVALLILILRNYRRQTEFEYSDHVVPEDYDSYRRRDPPENA